MAGCSKMAKALPLGQTEPGDAICDKVGAFFVYKTFDKQSLRSFSPS